MIGLNLKILLYPLAIFAFISATYFQVYNFDFINFDDNIYVYENPVVLKGLSKDGLIWAFKSTEGGHWHPLSWISHMLDVELWGANPGPMHLVNLGFHITNSLLLFYLILLIFKNPSLSLFSTLLFALSPLRLESVAWISQRKDLLSLFLGLITCILYVKFIGSRSKSIYLLSSLTFILALLAKPTMIVIPILILIIEIVYLIKSGKFQRSDSLFSFLSPSKHINKTPYLILALLCATTALYSQQSGGGLRSLDEFSLEKRFNLALPAYIIYLGKIFWPFNTTIYYPVINYPSGLAFACFICLVFISFSLWKVRNTYPEFILGWAWFIISLLPVAGFITIGSQALADRWTQLAHIGPIVGLLAFLLRNYPRPAKIIIATLIFSLSIISFKELNYWKNSETIFRRSLEINSDNFMAHTNLGATLKLPEQSKERIYHYEEAARLNPTFPEALNNLGVVRAEQGNFSEAINLFEKALGINPKLTAVRNNLAQAKHDSGVR